MSNTDVTAKFQEGEKVGANTNENLSGNKTRRLYTGWVAVGGTFDEEISLELGL